MTRADVGHAIAGATGRLTDAGSSASPRVVVRQPRTRRSRFAPLPWVSPPACRLELFGSSPWTSLSVGSSRSAAFRRAELIPSSLHGRALGAPRSIRIAPAPLNSDRLPSMRRRRVHYPSGLEHAGENIFPTTSMRLCEVNSFNELGGGDGRKCTAILVERNAVLGPLCVLGASLGLPCRSSEGA
jgi:hypothetical protein